MRSVWNSVTKEKNLLLICILSIGLGFSLAANFYNHSEKPAIAAQNMGISGDWRTTFVNIADQLGPSVVNITSEKTIQQASSPFDDFFAPFGMQSAPRKETETATGTGVIIRSDGYILTNNHVVAGADRVTVMLKDGREFKGKVFRDSRTDLAVVKIDAKDLPAAQFADSDKVKVGQWVAALGSPYGLRNTLTVGVVSAIRKQASDKDTFSKVYPEAIQTDASINPGNSGGPLVDTDGKIVGINFMIFSSSGANAGVGFAIPSNTAKFIANQLIEKGKVVRGYFGLIPKDLTPGLAKYYGATKGALVESVDKGSPADKGGIKSGDVITKIDGKEIDSAIDLRHTVQAIAPGTVVKVVAIRNKTERVLSVKLDEAPNTSDETANDDVDKVGVTVQALTPQIAKQLGIDENTTGVLVQKVEPGSAAERAGIQVKDVITEVDNMPITSVASFLKAAKALKSGDTAVVVILRDNRNEIIEMPID